MSELKTLRPIGKNGRMVVYIDFDKAREMGLYSLVSIAEHLGVSRQAIHQYATRQGALGYFFKNNRVKEEADKKALEDRINSFIKEKNLVQYVYDGYPTTMYINRDGESYRRTCTGFTPNNSENTKTKYQRFAITTDKGNTLDSVHRAVAKTFIPVPDEVLERCKEQNSILTVDHINGDVNDNRVVNLQWLSLKDNIEKYYDDKRIRKEQEGSVE